jgi:hypothetical protein
MLGKENRFSPTLYTSPVCKLARFYAPEVPNLSNRLEELEVERGIYTRNPSFCLDGSGSQFIPPQSRVLLQPRNLATPVMIKVAQVAELDAIIMTLSPYARTQSTA